VQFVLPREPFVRPDGTSAVKQVRLRRAAGGGGGGFSLYYQDTHFAADAATAAIAVPYPPASAVAGDPVHLTVFRNDSSSGGGGGGAPQFDRLMAVWISFRQPAAAYDCAAFDSCCNITAANVAELQPGGRGIRDGSCDLGPPSWRCFTPAGSPWTSTAAVGFVNFLGPLANSGMARGGRSVLLHLADGVDVGVPLTNTYAEHAVVDSPACRALCAAVGANPAQLDLFGLASAHGCTLASQQQQQQPAVTQRAKAGFGRISVNGFGRVDGQAMMRAFLFQNRTTFPTLSTPGTGVWADPLNGVLNGYGGKLPGFKNLGEAEAHTRWRVMSGLLELSSAGGANGDSFGVEVSELAVAWGAKRGDGGVRLQFPRVALDGAHAVADSNVPARLYDLKTPGTWVGAADGPRVVADGSVASFLYNHHGDDNLKVDSSGGTWSHVTLLQGNIGAAVELGTYGIGLRDNTVSGATVSGVYVHRITQPDGQDDGIGSLLGSRTCPWGITLRNITVRGLYVPAAGGANAVTALVRIGTLGAPTSAAFANVSSLDRWYFCSNEWWRDGQKIVVDGEARAATLSGLRFLDWRVHAPPRESSWLYNFHTSAQTVIEKVALFDDGAGADHSRHGGGLARDDDDGPSTFAWPDAVRVFPHGGEIEDGGSNSGYFVTPCLGRWRGDPAGEQCWDSRGEILARRADVCSSGTCTNFGVIGMVNSTTVSAVHFPFGADTAIRPS